MSIDGSWPVRQARRVIEHWQAVESHVHQQDTKERKAPKNIEVQQSIFARYWVGFCQVCIPTSRLLVHGRFTIAAAVRDIFNESDDCKRSRARQTCLGFWPLGDEKLEGSLWRRGRISERYPVPNFSMRWRSKSRSLATAGTNITTKLHTLLMMESTDCFNNRESLATAAGCTRFF